MKNILKNKKVSQILKGIGLLLLGLIIGWLLFGGNSNTSKNKETHDHQEQTHQHEKKGAVWTCSMHPQIKQDKPGKCPICGMTLIPLQKNEEEAGPMTVSMSQAAMKIAEVETTVIEKIAPYKEIYLPGKVKADERKISELTSRYPGRIEKLNINFTGQYVAKGQVLATIYSPDLVTAQKELFESKKFKETSPQLYQAARNKLRLWDLTQQQIDDIENSGELKYYFEVLSPLSGTVTMRHVSIGDYVKEGTPLFEIINLSRVWVMFDAYESNLPWIKLRDKINFTIKSLPGKIFTAKVTFIDPVIDSKTRVAYVRTEIRNSRGLLKPEMFASGILKTMLPGVKEAVTVPKSAVLWTGKKAVVYVKNQKSSSGLFSYREIILGEESDKYYVVKKGLEEGEEIVTNGVFKIDAAAQLEGKRSMMNPDGGKVSMGHNHGGDSKDKKKTDQKEDHSQHKGMKEMIVDQKFKIQLSSVYKDYLKLKDGFVGKDNKSIKKEANNMAKSLKQVDMALVKGEMHVMWMKQLNSLNKFLTPLLKGNHEQHHAEFAGLSDALHKSIKSFGLDDVGKVYYQFCPMALDNKGAYWLSDKKEIRNPYFGEQMLGCGENKEIIQ